MKKILFSLLSTFVAAGSLTGLVHAEAGTLQTSQKEKVLKLNLRSDVPSTDPALAEDNTSIAIVRATFDGLTRTGVDGKPHNSMASKIDVSEDLQTYTFTLRDAKWSNGDPVTAYDFEYAWKHVIDPQSNANYAYMMYSIKNAQKANRGQVKLDEVGIKALDDKTLKVTLEKPTPYFLELTAFSTYFPVDKKIAEKGPQWASEAKTHIGNGPFKIEQWEHRKKLVLVKNKAYWDAANVNVDRIHFNLVEDEKTELAMFEKGELDWAGRPLTDLPIDAIPGLKKSGKLKTQAIAGTYWLKLNTEKAPFTNPKIRRAFSYAINRQAIIDQVTQANQLPATGIVPPTMQLKSEGYFKDNDAATAKKLLQEGLKEMGLKQLPPITYSFNTSEGHLRIAETIQKQWKDTLGVEVKLENKEWKVYIEDLHNGQFQIGRMGWLGDFNDPINYLELFKDKQGGNNDTLWENAKYKELLNQSDKETDPAKRTEILEQAEQIIMDESPVIPIYFYTDSWVQNDKVKGVVIDGLGNIDYKWATVE
ncbi:peptide ABC transporter substrate-binding protein [Brevibacillus ginsengisoli]|uniref:peptide ABC transporter substrate-binding protein n=1 Tax=Brevibacillus ginsengisoli TaxID=363854 RepID=UPI003CEBAC2B